MEDLNNKFEKDWKDAFDGAEEEPHGMVWQNIESALANKDIQHYKRKYFYAQVAAAVLLLLFLPLSGYFVYQYRNDGIAVKSSGDVNEKSVYSPKKINDSDLAFEKDNRADGVGASGKDAQEGELPLDSGSEKESGDRQYFAKKQKNEFDTRDQVEIQSSGSLLRTNEEIPNVIKSETDDTNSGNSKENKKEDMNLGDGLFEGESFVILDEKKLSNKDDNFNSKKDKSLSESNLADQTPIHSTSLELIALNAKGPVIRESRLKPMFIYLWKNEGLFVKNDNKKEKKKINRWSAAVDFIPNYTNQNFESKAMSMPAEQGFALAESRQENIFFSTARTTLDESAKELETMSSPSFSYTSGFNGAYKINSKLSVEMGIKWVYSEAKVSTSSSTNNRVNVNPHPAFNMVLKEVSVEEAANFTLMDATAPGVVYNNFDKSAQVGFNNILPIDTYSKVNIYTQYIGVPLTLNYKLLDKKVDISIGGGVSSDFFIKYGSKDGGNSSFESETIKRSDESAFRPITFSLLIAPELEWGFSSRSSVYLRPIYKGALHSFTDTERISSKPRSMGLGFGLKYNLR